MAMAGPAGPAGPQAQGAMRLVILKASPCMEMLSMSRMVRTIGFVIIMTNHVNPIVLTIQMRYDKKRHFLKTVKNIIYIINITIYAITIILHYSWERYFC